MIKISSFNKTKCFWNKLFPFNLDWTLAIRDRASRRAISQFDEGERSIQRINKKINRKKLKTVTITRISN